MFRKSGGQCRRVPILRQYRFVDPDFWNNHGEMSSIQDRLSTALEASESSQADLAKSLNRSRSALSEWKAGRSEPDLATFAKLCTLLGVSADWVLGLEAKAKSPVSRPLVAAIEGKSVIDESRLAEAIAETMEGVDTEARVATVVASCREAGGRAAGRTVDRLRSDAQALAKVLARPAEGWPTTDGKPSSAETAMGPVARMLYRWALRVMESAASAQEKLK